MKIGILGGTFDPIHKAHMELGRAAQLECGLDKMLVIPTGNPYLKSGKRDITPSAIRADMVRLAIADEPSWELSEIEMHREGETYTADTLEELQQMYPGAELYFIMGADSLRFMDRWYRPEGIFDRATVVAGSRSAQVPDQETVDAAAMLREKYGARIVLLSWEGDDISSTDLRESLASGGEWDGRIDRRVYDYIREHGIYMPSYSPYTIDEMKERLQDMIKPSRYEHSLAVADTAVKLADHYGTSTDKAYAAGLLHDCGKYSAGALEHASVGAQLAADLFKVYDPDIINAIRTHTTGEADMSMLQKIIYVADYIEPGRDKAKNLDRYRREAFEDLDMTVYNIAADTLEYLRGTKAVIDAKTEEVYNYYKPADRRETRMDKIREMVRTAYKALTDKLADDITVIDITDVTTVADYFIITNGNNVNHVHTLVDGVEEAMGRAGFECKAIEGYRSGNWVLMDFGDIVIHVFSKEDRRFFDLERIWRDGKVLADADIVKDE